MLTQLIAVGCLVTVFAQDATLSGSRIPQNLNTQPRESYRDSVAKSIRDNIARQKLVKNQETIIYYGNDQPQYRAQPFQAPPRAFEQRRQYASQETPIPRIRIPIPVSKRQHISPTTVAPIQQYVDEQVFDYVDEVTEEIPETTTTTEAPTTRRPLPARINVQETYPEPSLRRSKKPPTQGFTPVSNDVETRRRLQNEEEAEDQARSAHYQFSSSVDDTINDNAMSRSETREGTALIGMFSYSDGFFRRTVHYRADENGYRVTKEEMIPINNGDGPQYNPDGKADVSSSLAGSYSITADDIRGPLRQEKEKRRFGL